MRSLFYYLFILTALVFYGVEVCPYLEGLSNTSGFFILTGTFGIFFLNAYIIRYIILMNILKNTPLIHQSRKQLYLEGSLFIAIGLGITIFDTLVFKFPLGSGLKVLVGCMALGLFATIDIVLERERVILSSAVQSGEKLGSTDRFISLPRKFMTVTVLVMVLIIVVLILLIVKDFEWLLQNIKTKGIMEARRSVIFEIIFVMIVIFGLAINLIYSYSMNLKLYFQNQTNILDQVSNGNFEGYVPVVSHDEFGIIAKHTNEMIEGLREKNRIKNLFGKVVSPQIAKRFMEGDGTGGQLDGSRQNLVVLMSDIRNFTTTSEKSDPDVLVQDLNLYFTEMVSIINSHGGLVDKFIGDGILAIFGLDNPDNAVEEAVNSAVKMQLKTKFLPMNVFKPLEVGIGIHCGDVVAGVIGSPDRLEYTFIGDTVNTAARLESMTKPLNTSIVISSKVYDIIRDKNSFVWENYGDHALKGKEKSLSLYGIHKDKLS